MYALLSLMVDVVDSSVCIVAGYRLDGQGLTRRARDFSVLHNIQTGSGV